MRALTMQLMRRPKDPDPDPNDFNNAYPFDNSNLDNGNVMTPMDMDFKSGSGLSAAPIVKTERMDFDMNNGGNQDHLNANRPQDAALIPGAENSKITPNSSTIPQIKVTKETTGTAKTAADKPKSSSNKTVNFNNDHINHLEIKALKSKPSSSTSKSGLSSSKSNKAVDIKPSVSITPVSSADAAMMNLKKPTGIEIIPLGDKLPKESSNKDTTLLKEIKRSFSEDDKRRFDKKTDAKKRKRDHYLSSKNDEKKSRPSSSSKESGIEIIKYDKSKESSENKSSAMKSPQQSLKLTIKSTSSSKHRSSDYHHKSKHSSTSSSSKHSSSSSAKRSSPSLSQMMKHSSSKSSSSSSSSSSKSKEKERQQQRDKDRIEEVKRLLGGNKLDTTFQIPKRTKPEEKKQATTTSNSKSLLPPSSGSNASPRYPGSISPPDISPKYSGSSSSASSSTTGTPRKPTSPPPILSPSNKNSGQPPMTSTSSSAAVATFMSLPSSGGANAQSPPLLAAFDKGCDKDLNNVSSTGLSK